MHCHAGSNQQFTIESGGLLKAKSGQCLAVSAIDPAHSGGGDPGAIVKVSDFSLWAKPQPEGATAVFLLSNQNATTQKPSTVRPLLLPIPRPGISAPVRVVGCRMQVTITFAELGLKSGASMDVEDIWSGQTHAKAAAKEFVTDAVGGHDSRFYLLKPATGN